MQMAVPPAIGWWIDGQLNTAPWLLILGAVFGFTVSLFELVKFAKESAAPKR
jgi:F0F1-type ATP synthase assembly protein I